MSLYALLMLATLSVPLLMSFHKKVSYYKVWPQLFAGIIINAIVFIIWDIWFTSAGVWEFNPQYVWQTRWFGLPAEEWLFFIIVPYSSIFIYQSLKSYVHIDSKRIFHRYISVAVFILLIVTGLFNYDKLYTSINCMFASILLAYQIFINKKTWMNYFWPAYLIHLIPFLIINGYLTSMPVVIYNSSENLSIRIFSIPVEDTIYALSCLLFPIIIMEHLLMRKK